MSFEKGFSFFKYTLYALLAFNIYLFFQHATFHEGLDSIGWLMLLTAFEWQTRKNQTAISRTENLILLAVQAAAYGLVLYAWGNYYLHGQWLDFINASLWLGVVLTICADLYWDHKWSKGQLHRLIKITLYSGLMVIAVMWGVEGDILNFYDAFLWIVCFFAIEMNLVHHVRHTWRWMRKSPATH